MLINITLPLKGSYRLSFFFSTKGAKYSINSGEIEVSKNGSTYEITFEGTTSEGKDISVNYKGLLSTF